MLLSRVRVQVDERTKSAVQHMKYEADQRKLEDLMSGRYRGPSHQVSTVSRRIDNQLKKDISNK